jgi:hypothetical protein
MTENSDTQEFYLKENKYIYVYTYSVDVDYAVSSKVV